MKKVKIRIKRQANSRSEPYFEDFIYELRNENERISDALSYLSDEEKRKGRREIAWDRSCLQKKCGACAVLINGSPALSCDTFIKDIKTDVIEISPLKKFPVVEDLIVDRSVMQENLKELKIYFNEKAKNDGDFDMAYEAARCLQCGLCLEVCPNFYPEGKFFGMAGMTGFARLIARLKKEERKEKGYLYKKGIYEGCGKALACRDVCPAKLDIDMLLSRSNAAAVWRRWRNYEKEYE